jgi:RNA polymerase sigma factor (sigma-70 family)
MSDGIAPARHYRAGERAFSEGTAMANATLGVVLEHLRRATATADEPPDPQLVERFLRGHDPASFAALVRRHGPMVLRVCRRVLRHHQDAEDAFQVTFLVLARSAASIRKRGSLASWLHGVAYRTAKTARRGAATRREYEGRVKAMSQKDASEDLAWREVQSLLDEEVATLPEPYRTAFVLCQLEGLSRQEVARRLGVKEGTVSSRLGRAREQLREKLARRGVSLAALLGALAFARGQAPAAVPRRLLGATIRAGVAYAEGDLPVGGISAGAERLLKEVTRAMVLTQTKVAAAALAAVLLAAGALAFAPHPAHSQVPPAAPQGPAKTSAPDGPPAPGSGAAKPALAARAEGDTESVTVSGQVLGPDSKPFAGAEVSARWYQLYAGGTARGEVKTTSGPDGRFRLRFATADLSKTRLPPLPHIPHSYLEIIATAKGHGFGWAWAQIGAQVESRTLRLAKDDVPIKGRVLDLQFRPVAGATVRVAGVGPSSLGGNTPAVTTDAQGRFVLTGVGRDRQVALAVTGPGIERKAVTASTAGAAAATVEVVARPTRVLEGTVRAGDTGEPLAGVVVRGGPSCGIESGVHAVTDAQGRYRLVGLPKGRRYEVTAWPGLGQPFIPKLVVVVDTAGLKPISADLRLQRGVALRVRLLDKGTGKPVRGMVQYEPLGNNPLRAGIWDNRSLESRLWGLLLWQFPTCCFPEKDGYLHLVALPGPGAVFGHGYDFPYPARPFGPADVKTFPALERAGALYGYGHLFQSYRVFEARADGKPLTLDIEMDPGRTAEGVLVGPDSKPVAGATAFGLTRNSRQGQYDYVSQAWVGSEILKTERFRTPGVRPGTRTATFLHAGRKLIANVVLSADPKGPQTVRMGPWGTVTGRLVDAAGKPVTGVTVELLYESQEGPGELPPFKGEVACGLVAPGRPLCTDAEGRFRVEGLVPGLKHRLTFATAAGAGLTPVVPERVRDLSPRSGEVVNLGDVCVNVAPAGKQRAKGGEP